MSFGFAGASGTGKTTLAKRVAEELGWYFHDASVSRIMKEAGINAVGNVPLPQRIEAQEFLLKRYLQDLARVPRPMITDRTPLDMIGYMLGEVTMHNTDAATGERIHDYMMACIEAAVVHFDSIIIVRPLTTYAVDPKRPPLNRGYQDVVQLLIEGSAGLVSEACFVEYLHHTDLDIRAAVSRKFLLDRMAHIQAQAHQTIRH